MKVVLVTLSGNPHAALENIASQYPQSIIETISRTELEAGSFLSRLRALRSHRPDIFAIATEKLEWQRGQDLFMLFGALAGAGEVVLIDGHGKTRRASRGKAFSSAPAQLLRNTTSGAAIVARARRELKQLERDIEQRSGLTLSGGASQSLNPDVVYLRATPGPGTQSGGAASHIKGVTQALQQMGANVRLISNDAIAGLSGGNIAIIQPEPVGATRAVFEIHNNNIFTRGALPLIEERPPNFIYQRYARFGWTGVVARLRTGRPLFLEYNGSEVWVGRHWDRVGLLGLLARYERLNLAAAARIFVVSEVERRNLAAAGVSPGKIVVNPNGVDPNVFSPGTGGEQIHAELGVKDGETLVGFVGSFGPWHGVLVLAEAIRNIPDSHPIRFLMVGTGSLQSRVKELLEAEKQQRRVIFTGAVAHEKVPALLDACDVLVSPHVPLADGSEFFGSPTKIFEYMAMGKGIVASRLGQIGEVLDHEETALLVEPGNANELRDAIVRLAESQKLREKLGDAARRIAIERHTWKRNAQRVLDAYSELLAESNS